jgi:hypothetical protein
VRTKTPKAVASAIVLDEGAMKNEERASKFDHQMARKETTSFRLSFKLVLWRELMAL